MITRTILDPDSGRTKTIVIDFEASMVIQDLVGQMEFFITLSTTAKDVSGNAITRQSITALSDGAGGAGLDRHGAALAGGKYASMTVAIDDYIAMMVEGRENEPWTEMAF